MNLFNKFKLLALLGALTLVAPIEAHAQQVCPEEVLPQVVVKVGAGQVKSDYTKTSPQIAYIAKTDGQVPFKIITADDIDLKKSAKVPITNRADYMNGIPVGLYLPKPVVEVAAQFETTTSQKNRTSCMRAKAIVIDIKLYPEIYITNEANFRNRSACFQAILEHKNMHDKIAKTVFLEYQKIMQQNIEGIRSNFSMMGPFPAQEKAYVQNQVTQAIVNKATQIMALANIEESKRQAKLNASLAKKNKNVCKKVAKSVTKKIKNSNVSNR